MSEGKATPVRPSARLEPVAIIGMSGRFPGARDVDEFWKNLEQGVESISFFSDEELVSAGIDPSVLTNPAYVKAGGVMEDAELFDAGFFGYNPREAEFLDPQQRILLECAWEALESAGYDPQRYAGNVGVWAGCGMMSYYVNNLADNAERVAEVGRYQTLVGNVSDFAAPRVAYKLNLRGPAYTVLSACSSSLVAVHVACTNLQTFQCDMALAGGVYVRSPRKAGYFYQEGMIMSPDGHCRAFDERAAGIVTGEGVGLVVLKRLSDAMADGDFIHAVIRGSAVNNDGSLKVGFTAPSVDGQASVIRLAQELAGIDPGTIGYVEAHGTATHLGDPIEVAALTKAFRASTQRRQYCAIGSVKTNIGHLDAAAGIAGLIKAALAVREGAIPPSLHYTRPNPELRIEESPFYVNTTHSPWPSLPGPRRAAVNSFGIGGTNAHVIIEEAPRGRRASRGSGTPASASRRTPTPVSRAWHLFPISARTETGLETATERLREHLSGHPEISASDAAYTLQVGRRAFDHRRLLICQDTVDAVTVLTSRDPSRLFSSVSPSGGSRVAFLFSGQGSQYVSMARGLYEGEPDFRAIVDLACEKLTPILSFDLRTILYPGESSAASARELIDQTVATQPALFVIEYALATLLMGWGITPAALIGHSVGELVAACVAGVFDLDAALGLVATRGRLVQELPAGSMLSVFLPADEVLPLLGTELDIAAINAPSLCVVSGKREAVRELQELLEKRGVGCRPLHTSHAFHSRMMDPALPAFLEQVRSVRLEAPRIPLVSSLTGGWITEAEAKDPRYWVRQLREPVRFSEGCAKLFELPRTVLLEVGPGRALTTLATTHTARPASGVVIPTTRDQREISRDDTAVLQSAIGKLWVTGVDVDWSALHRAEAPMRIPLPTYPFERQRLWIDPPRDRDSLPPRPSIARRSRVDEWLYFPTWKRQPAWTFSRTAALGPCLVLMDEQGLGAALAVELRGRGATVVTVKAAKHWQKLGDDGYGLDPGDPRGYERLIGELLESGRLPAVIAHLWSLDAPDLDGDLSRASIRRPAARELDSSLRLGFSSLLFLVKALGERSVTEDVQLAVVSRGLHDVTGEEKLRPENATLVGSCRVIPQEYPNIACRCIDVEPWTDAGRMTRLASLLTRELGAPVVDAVVAYRGRQRWVPVYEPIPRPPEAHPATLLKESGVYLITGGLGNIGMTFARFLAREVHARIALLSRTAVPPRESWDEWLASHGSNDPASRAIESARSLEAAGATVLTVRADVADEKQMAAAIAVIEQRLGRLDGVIHAAGVIGDATFRPIPDAGAKDCEEQLRPKARGLLVLDKILKDRGPDFVLLASSLSAVLGGIGFFAYASANSFMDAFAHSRMREAVAGERVPATRWMSVNWDAWRFSGPARTRGFGDELSQLAIVPEEGTAVFQRLFSLDGGWLPQVIVSTADLGARMDRWSRPLLSEKPQAAAPEETGKPAGELHGRPHLSTAYEAPRSETDKAIARIWQDLLGIDGIGINDSFFDLGGHSLLATQVISRLRRDFHVTISLRTLFEAPTIAALSPRIEEGILAEIEKLSEAEAERALDA